MKRAVMLTLVSCLALSSAFAGGLMRKRRLERRNQNSVRDVIIFDEKRPDTPINHAKNSPATWDHFPDDDISVLETNGIFVLEDRTKTAQMHDSAGSFEVSNNAVSVHLWFNTTNDVPNDAFMWHDGLTILDQNVFAITLNSSEQIRCFLRAANDEIILLLSAASNFNDGVWHQVVYTRDGDVDHLYIDGAFEAAGTNNLRGPIALKGGVNPTFGRNQFSDNDYIGLLDTLLIFERAITSDEVRELYELERKSKGR